MPFDPEEARRRVREQKYWNRADEVDAIRAVDNAVFERIANHERGLLDDAAEHLKRAEALNGNATELARALVTDIAVPIKDGVDLETLAQPYKSAVASVEKMIADLEHAATSAEFWAARLDDPVADATRLWARLPEIAKIVRI
jgi:hypothetical protein